MSDVTREDAKTVLLFSLHLARIDSQFDAWEKKTLQKIAQVMKLSDAEMGALSSEKISLSQSLGAISGVAAMDLLAKTLCVIASSDGIASDNESQFIKKVVKASGHDITIGPETEWEKYEAEVLRILGEIAAE